MAYDAKTERLIALKKLAGKAQTSNDKGLANEGLPSGITSTSETIFGETITTAPSATSLYTITGQVEYVRFTSTFIAGSDTSDGRHGFELKLPSDYETNSSNSKKGTYPFINSQTINITSGALQLIPPSFATSYEAKPYYGGTGVKDSGTQIPLLDNRDWYLDYFNGVFFQQDPTGTGDQSDNPDYVEGYLYIGKMLDTVVSAGSSSGGNGDKSPQYLVLAATASLPNERVFTTGIGIKSTDSGAGAAYTIAVRDSVVATLTGSIFSGIVSAPAFSGSLTKLQDGSSYLIAGSNTTIVTGSSGAITISSAGNIDGSGAANRIATWSDSNTLTSDADFTWNGSLLDVQGDVNLNGTVVVNQSGVNKDFRVETQNKSSALQVDGETDQVLLFSGSLSDAAGHGSSASDPDPRAFTDTNFFVSGSIDSRGTSRRGTSVFGGDVLSSGSLLVQGGITGSLTQLSDGTSYLRAGSNITITSGSGGFVTITSTGTPGTGDSDKRAAYLVLAATGSLENERVFTEGTGIKTTDAGAGGAYTIAIRDSIVATLTGSVFSGAVTAPAFTGSLQLLSDGTSYLKAGSNVTITSSSAGSVTIASSGAGESRSKQSYFLSSDFIPGAPIAVGSSDFSAASYNPQKIDVYLNGQLVHSGSVLEVNAGDRDYYVSSATSLKFSFKVVIHDVLDVIVFSVS